MNEIQTLRLTREAISPKLESGTIFMSTDNGSELDLAQAHAVEQAKAAKKALADEKSEEQHKEAKRLQKERDRKTKKDEDEAETKVAPTQAELVTAWEEFVNQYPKGSEARKQAEEQASKLIKQGKSPDEITSKGLVEETASQVVENVLLDEQSLQYAGRFKELSGREKISETEKSELLRAHSQRLSKTEKLLGRELTDKQKIAVIKAHYVGYGEEGVDGGKAGPYNLTKAQIAEKARILKEAGISPDERRVIIESGVAAAGPVDYKARRDTAITALNGLILTGRMDQIRNAIRDAHLAAVATGGIPSGDLRRYLDEFDKVTHEEGSAHPNDEVTNLGVSLREIQQLDDSAAGRSKIEDAFLLRHQYLEGQIAAGDPDASIQLRNEIQEFVANVNVFETGIRDETAKILVDFAQTDPAVGLDAIERFAIKVIGAPLGAETGDYDLGFYGRINLDAIVNALNSRAQEPDSVVSRPIKALLKARVKDITNTAESLRLFHELNRIVIRGNLEDVDRYAALISSDYAQALQRRKGVATIQRLLEAAHAVTVSKDGMIKVDNEKVMMGTKMNKVTGRFEATQPESVFAEVRAMLDYFNAHPTLAPGHLQDLVGLKDWELDFAFSTARSFFNTQQRKAVWVSQGQIPEGSNAWQSIPDEAGAKLFNAGRWLYERFRFGSNRGGMTYWQMVVDAMQRHRPSEGLGTMQLDKIRDDKVESFELPAMTGIRDWSASWRAIGGILRQHRGTYEPLPGTSSRLGEYRVFHYEAGSNRTEVLHDTSLGLMLNHDALEFVKFDANGRPSETIKWGKASDQMKADYFRSVFLEVDPTDPNGDRLILRKDLHAALGVLYKTRLTPSGGHGAHKNHELNNAKEQIRRLIWERVAEENPLAAISYLHGLKYSDGHSDAALRGRTAFKDYLDAHGAGVGANYLDTVYTANGMDWHQLQRKLNFYNEIKLSKLRGVKDPLDPSGLTYVAGGDPNMTFTLQDAINMVVTETGGYDPMLPASNPRNLYNLSPKEVELLEAIKREGYLASSDMANVRYAFIPFMNDVLLEDFDYDQPGPQAYVRHYRDMANFSSANSAAGEALDNMGKLHDYEKIGEFGEKFTKGIIAVHGDEYAKDKFYPFAEALIRFYRRGENVFDTDKDYPGEKNLTFEQRFERWIRHQDETSFFLEGAHKPNSIAQKAFNSVHLPAFDRMQEYNLMHELLALGVMGHEEEDELKKKLGGGIFRYILKMFWEQAFRVLKVGAAGAAVTFVKEAFNPKDVLKE